MHAMPELLSHLAVYLKIRRTLTDDYGTISFILGRKLAELQINLNYDYAAMIESFNKVLRFFIILNKASCL